LVIKKQSPSATASSSPVRSASGASGALPVVGSVPAGIQALLGDIDRFAKEWTEMFDELSAGAEDPEDRLSESKWDAPIRVCPTGRPEDVGPLRVNTPEVGKGTPKRLLLASSGTVASVGSLQGSTLAGTNAETVHFDVTPASLMRWQHRDKSMVKDAPEDDKPVRKPFSKAANIQPLC